RTAQQAAGVSRSQGSSCTTRVDDSSLLRCPHSSTRSDSRIPVKGFRHLRSAPALRLPPARHGLIDTHGRATAVIVPDHNGWNAQENDPRTDRRRTTAEREHIPTVRKHCATFGTCRSQTFRPTGKAAKLSTKRIPR